MYAPRGFAQHALAPPRALQLTSGYAGALYCELRAHRAAPRPAAAGLRQLLSSLSVPADDIDDVAVMGALLRSATNRRRLIIMLDDAADAVRLVAGRDKLGTTIIEGIS